MMQLPMDDSGVRNNATEPVDPQRESPNPEAFLSDESTIELVTRARSGDRMAVEALMQRCLPSLKRWAHGRLPAGARGHFDTGDLVQDAALHVLGRLHAFEPRHVGAMQAYLRQTVINRIRDEVRRVIRQPVPVELVDDHPSDGTSPLEEAIRAETYQRYRAALTRLSSRDRQLIVARVEVCWSLHEISDRFGLRTLDAARMAVTRALRRLREQLDS